MNKAVEDIKDNFSKYNTLFDKIREDKSKQVFKDILNFRKNLNLNYMEKYKVDPIGQYFEDFLNLGKDEVFVDAGGYHGETTLEFIKHCPNYKSVYFLEPAKSSMSVARNNLEIFSKIIFLEKGISNKKETLRFDNNLGSANIISNTGLSLIEVDKLDVLVEDRVTFIKMDLEGAEARAIEGAKKHIRDDHPKLAISVYHKYDDFHKLSDMILDIRDDYDIYMRHYTEGTDETVMFFIPIRAT